MFQHPAREHFENTAIFITVISIISALRCHEWSQIRWGERQSWSLSPGKTTGRLLRENKWLSCAFHLVLSETTTQLSPPQGSSSPLSPPARSVTIPDQLLNTCRLQPIIFKGPISSRFTFCFHQPKQTHSSLIFVLDKCSQRCRDIPLQLYPSRWTGDVCSKYPTDGLCFLSSEVRGQPSARAVSQTFWPPPSHDTHSGLCITCSYHFKCVSNGN